MAEFKIKVDISDVIEDLKKRDIVEVVRCKDCKHLMFSDISCECGEGIMYCECGRGVMGVVSPDDYCSRGEKE